MNQTQLGLMLKQTWEKVRWIPDQQEWRWKDGDVHLSLSINTRCNNATYESEVSWIHLSVRDVDTAHPVTDRVPVRSIGRCEDNPTAAKVRAWLVKAILTEQFK